MAELRDFSPAQIEEAIIWIEKNCRGLYIAQEFLLAVLCGSCVGATIVLAVLAFTNHLK